MPRCTELLVCSLNTYHAVSLFQVSGSLFPLSTSCLCFHSPPSKTWLNSYHSFSGGRNELIRTRRLPLFPQAGVWWPSSKFPQPSEYLYLSTYYNPELKWTVSISVSHTTLSTFRPENVCPVLSDLLNSSFHWIGTAFDNILEKRQSSNQRLRGKRKNWTGQWRTAS